MHPTVRVRRLAFTLLFLTVSAVSPAAFDDTEIARFDFPDWFKTTFYELADDLADAHRSGRQGIVLFFSTAGCSYCKRMLDESFADPQFGARLREHFDVIGLEIFSDSEITDWRGETQRVSAFAKAHGVQFSPTLVFVDTAGRRLLRLVGYYDTAFLDSALDYLQSGAAATMTLRDWRDRSPVPAATAAGPASLSDDPLFSLPPYQLDRRRKPSDRPLLVLFDEGGCNACREFHRQVLTDPAIRRALRGFDAVRLDAGDDSRRLVAPDGSAVTAAEWYRSLGFARLPAIAVFDAHGQPVLQTDALVRRGRFNMLLRYVRDRVYLEGWTYQRYARSENSRRMQEEPMATAGH